MSIKTVTDPCNTNIKLSRAELAYQQLLEAIREGRLTSGSRLRENEIMQWLGISRLPVREALRRLQSDGLISSIPYRGITVTRLDYQQIIELYQMREVLEGTAAALAARHASPAEIAMLRKALAPTDKHCDAQQLARHDRQFHHAIYHTAHNRYLLKSLDSLRDTMVLLGHSTYTEPRRCAAAQQEHERIFRAIEEGKPETAEVVAREHVRSAQQARLALLDFVEPCTE
jgi:DNA-binding GntR family transcriptional regulator